MKKTDPFSWSYGKYFLYKLQEKILKLTEEILGKGSVLEDRKSLSLSKLVVAITVTSVAAAFLSRLKKIYQNKDVSLNNSDSRIVISDSSKSGQQTEGLYTTSGRMTKG